jgi:hypothetical protein
MLRPTIILLLRVFFRESAFVGQNLATTGGIHIQTHKQVGETYEARRRDGLSCHNIHKNWFTHSKMRTLIFFNLPNPYNHVMALEFTQPLIEMSTRKCFWGVGSGKRVTLTSQPSVSRLSRKRGVIISHKPIGHHGLLRG